MSSRPSEKTLHTPKKASRARSRSLWLLYIKPLQFCAAHLSLKIESKNSLSLLNAPRGRKNAEQKDTTLNGAMRCKQLSQNLVSFFYFFVFFFFFFFSYLFFSNSLKEIGKEGMFRADAIRGAFLSLEISGALS